MKKTFTPKRCSFALSLHQLAAAFVLWLLAAVSPLDVRADGTVLYDGLYDRPTHYPDFSQPTAWSSTMSYFVYVRDANGSPLSNYEVAVYDQDGNLRHVGRSIGNQQELCTLTIPGQSGHTFSFKVIYGDFAAPTIVDAAETVSFRANAIVGGPLAPFWLTIPALALPGDVNRDGKVSISDMTALVKLLMDHPETFPLEADVNGDNQYDLQDVEALERLLLEDSTH